MMHQVQSLPITRIGLSQTTSQIERRAHFDKAAIAELAESLTTVGMLSPIIVRPTKGNGHDVELVAGERRYLAAKHAGLTEVPVSVRELTDEQVLEVQLVENLQREGLHELAEAEGYEALQKLGHSAEEIADKVGKSKAYVYARMKLLALSPAGRKAFYGSKITASVALLLARIPVTKLQEEALKQVTQTRWNDDSAMSYREAANLVQREYMLKLSDSGFKTEDATLVPAAGACGPCPKRTGNQRELFGDVKGADVCTDPVCFKAKLAAHAARVIEQAEARGQKIITGTAAKKIFPYHGDSPNSDQAVSLGDRCYEDSKQRTYGQLLGKDFEPTLVIHPESGKVVKVATRDQVRETFKDKGIKTAKSNVRNSDAAAQKRVKLERAYRRALYAAIRPKLPDHMGPEDYRVLALRLLERAGHDSVKILAELWELEPVKSKYGPPDFDEATGKFLKSLPEEQLPQIFFDLIFVNELHVWSYGSGTPTLMLATAKKLKINAEQIRKDCQPAKKAKRK
jgi:ParB/RepB/Spo0J family partition protein